MKIVYKGIRPSIQMGKYVFFKDKEREVPDDIAECILKKPLPFEKWEGKKPSKKTKSEIAKESKSDDFIKGCC